MSKGNVKKFVNGKGYESINRNMLQDVDNLSIDAIGLLAHLTSYPESWELYKTELYTRFKKSKRKKINTTWNELVEERYIVQLRRRAGSKYEYIYYHNQERFTDEDIEQIKELEKAELWDGKMTKNKNDSEKIESVKSDDKLVEEKPETLIDQRNLNCAKGTVQNGQSKVNCSNSAPNRLTREEVYYKEINNKEINNNQSVNESEINIDVPEVIKRELERQTDGLSFHSIDLDMLERNYKSNADTVNDARYAVLISKVLDVRDYKIKNFDRFMNSCIRNDLNDRVKRENNLSERVSDVPEWFVKGEHMKKPEDGNTDVVGDMTPEQIKIAEMLERLQKEE